MIMFMMGEGKKVIPCQPGLGWRWTFILFREKDLFKTFLDGHMAALLFQSLLGEFCPSSGPEWPSDPGVSGSATFWSASDPRQVFKRWKSILCIAFRTSLTHDVKMSLFGRLIAVCENKQQLFKKFWVTSILKVQLWLFATSALVLLTKN